MNEPSNKDRAERIARIVTSYQPISGEDPGDAIRDILADIQHYCAINAVDFEDALNSSTNAFVRETA